MSRISADFQPLAAGAAFPSAVAEQEDVFDARLGGEVGQLRRALGLQQDDLARLLGVTRSAVSHIENGKRRVTAYELAKLCTAFQIDPGYLLGFAKRTMIGWPPRAAM